MSKKFLLGCAAMIALIPLTSMISGCMEVDANGEPVTHVETQTLGPVTTVTWTNPRNSDSSARSYDEQTHMVCYERNGLPLGCLPLDYGVTAEEMKTGKHIPDPYSPDYKDVK